MPSTGLKRMFDTLRRLNLRSIFRVLGATIGTWPLAFVAMALLIALLSLGMVRLRLQNRVRDGYTPSTSPSRYENSVVKEFFGSSGDPALTTVLIRARDGGSMHRLRYLQATVEFHAYIRHNITITYPPSDNLDSIAKQQIVRYNDICKPFCDANQIINYFYDALKGQLSSVRASKKLYPSTNLTYPIARVNGFELHLERNFFGVSLTGSNSARDFNFSKLSESDRHELAELSQVTSIKHVEAVMMSFRGSFSHVDDEAKTSLWEMAVYAFVQDNFGLNSESLLDVCVIGNEIVDFEMNRDAQRIAPYFALGFLFMFGFCFVTILFSSWYFGSLDWAKFTLALCISICPTLAIITTFGLCALMGLRINSVMLIMPFLICGIGVDDAFLICHAWLRQTRRNLTVSNRMGLVLEEVGPSITITTLTNVITFGIGVLTPTPEISLFCLATAIALGFAYLYTLLLFTSFLCFATMIEIRTKKRQGLTLETVETDVFLKQINSIEEKRNIATAIDSAPNQQYEPKTNLQKRSRHFFKRIGDIYCSLLLNKVFGAILLSGTLIYWYFAVWGTVNINAKLDTEKILPKNSLILKPHRIITRLVWTEYYPVTVLVNNPIDIRYELQLNRVNAMVDEFESLPLCKGRNFTTIWLRDYAAYCEMVRDYGFDYFSDGDNFTNRSSFSSETGLDYGLLNQFLSSPSYKHFAPFLRLRNVSLSDNPVEKFWFLVTFHNTTDWQSRIDLMLNWRRVAANYADLNVTVWEVNGMFVDQMLSLKILTLQTTLVTLGCMTMVCALFIQNLFLVVTAVLAIGSISMGVIGFLSWWHLNLDPVTLCAVLMSIGMSVDFTAHICYHFQLTKRQRVCGNTVVEIPLKSSADKLRNTINSVAWPMSQAGLSTVICILPLIFLQDYIPLVFVKTVLLVVIWGMFHGLVLMPALLANFKLI